MGYFKNDKEKRNFIVSRSSNLQNIFSSQKFSNSLESKSSHCSDWLKFYINIEKDKIIDLKFETDSCVLTNVSTDILIDLLIGKSLTEAKNILEKYLIYINNSLYVKDLKELEAFENIIKKKQRSNCFLLGYSILIKLI